MEFNRNWSYWICRMTGYFDKKANSEWKFGSLHRNVRITYGECDCDALFNLAHHARSSDRDAVIRQSMHHHLATSWPDIHSMNPLVTLIGLAGSHGTTIEGLGVPLGLAQTPYGMVAVAFMLESNVIFVT